MDAPEPLPEVIEPSLERVAPGTANATPDAAVALAYAAHSAELYAFLRRSVRDAQTAEDLLHDAFVRLLRESRAGRQPQNARAWLYRVATNLTVSRARRLTVAARHLAGLARRDVEPAPEAAVVQREQDRQLEQVMGRLPADSRTALLLRGQGFAPAEIAAAIGRSEGATRTLLSRSRVRLRLLLEAAEAGQ